jgi:hypothetical protein
MTDYKATFEQWNDIEQWANSGSHASTDHCILELLSRIERLEEETRQENICNNKCIQIIAERFDRLEKTIDDNHKQTSNLKQIRSSLVERAGKAIRNYVEHNDDWGGEAKAAILVVAEWLREQNNEVFASQLIAMILEEEVKQ